MNTPENQMRILRLLSIAIRDADYGLVRHGWIGHAQDNTHTKTWRKIYDRKWAIYGEKAHAFERELEKAKKYKDWEDYCDSYNVDPNSTFSMWVWSRDI